MDSLVDRRRQPRSLEVRLKISASRSIHGHSNRKSPQKVVYDAWSNMKQRCFDKKGKAYHNYGGRGITVCERWLNFENFFEDMGMPPTKNHTLDRIDVNLGYSPDNCRWATRTEQMQNVRYNVWVEHNGEKLVMSEWARRCGVTPATMHRRLKVWPIEKAVTTINNRKEK